MFTDLDIGTALIAVAVGLFGFPLILVADRLSKTIQSQTGRILFVWPIGALGLILLGAVALMIIAHMIGPILILIWHLFKQA